MLDNIWKAHFSLATIKAQFSLVISKSPILIGNIKAQFSLAMSKSPVLTSNIKKPNFIGNTKSPILPSNIKKPDSYWYYLVKNIILLILGKYHMIKLPMPITTIVLKKKKIECSYVSKFMGNYDYLILWSLFIILW